MYNMENKYLLNLIETERKTEKDIQLLLDVIKNEKNTEHESFYQLDNLHIFVKQILHLDDDDQFKKEFILFSNNSESKLYQQFENIDFLKTLTYTNDIKIVDFIIEHAESNKVCLDKLDLMLSNKDCYVSKKLLTKIVDLEVIRLRAVLAEIERTENVNLIENVK